jgi:hypothetical protein
VTSSIERVRCEARRHYSSSLAGILEAIMGEVLTYGTRTGLPVVAVFVFFLAAVAAPPRQAAAADGDSLILGVPNFETTETLLIRSNGATFASGLRVTNDNGHALYGSAGTAPGVGVFADNTSGNESSVAMDTFNGVGYGVAGRGGNAGVAAQNLLNPDSFAYLGTQSRAGEFHGDVLVLGALTVTGAKSAAVLHSDGSYRRVYSVESPESMFEDFGTSTLVGGRGVVTLDPEFAALVQTNQYHVFLTPRGDSRGLYVSAQTSGGFEVREQQGGMNSLEFDYRVVAKRKDLAGPRLERVIVTSPRPPIADNGRPQ